MAILVFAISFFVTFFDNLYKLRTLEWVPNILGPILIVTSMYIWNPKWWKQRPRAEPDSARSTTNDRQD